jgi:hypothetical protein
MKKYSKKELIAFGNYLLSQIRTARVKKHPAIKHSVRERLQSVSDADFSNWEDQNEAVEISS